MRARSAILGGIVGPVTFVSTWAVLGATKPGYSPVDDPISRLAAVDASTRWPMTGGMLALGVGVGFFARGLRAEHPGAGRAALVTAAATFGIAATPLDSALGGGAHAAAAGLAYASLAAVPALAARDERAAGTRRGARVSALASAVTAVALTASVVGAGPTGLSQRIGLTAGHAWIVMTSARAAIRDLRDRSATQSGSVAGGSA